MSLESSSVWSSASASTWNLFCSWSMKAVFTLRSRRFSTSKCCPPLRLDMVFLSSSFSVVVSRLWSPPAAAPLLTQTFSSDYLHILLMIRWSIWFLSLPLKSTRLACRRLGVKGASLQWQNQRRFRCPVASLHCPSWCHILFSPWPFRCSWHHLQHLPREPSSKSSSHDVVCSPVLLQAVCEDVLAVLLSFLGA